MLAERARMMGHDLPLAAYEPDDAPRAGALRVLDVPLGAPCVAGRLDTANARHVLALLDRAIDGARSGEFAAMVTAPVQKSVINDAGVPFTGHTEYLAARTQARHPVMLLAAESLRVALATTHLPLRAVSDAITPALLAITLEIVHADVQRLWGISRPRIAVCGLNPHAGESGHLGTEDRDVIAPAVERARAAGMLKHSGFGHAVNVTLGLPIVRTSVDHGTALDLAGTGRADAGSLVAATRLAIEFAARVPAK
jgi:4-hydroxythreonine-4-phosphate dehydrogenase